MNWIDLDNIEQIERIIESSNQKPQIIFKHSTTCSISSMARNRLNKSSYENADFYYLDLIAHRNISNAIASKFDVQHESPQVLVIKNGICTYDESHYGINADELEEQTK